jgi:hypothetical protein
MPYEVAGIPRSSMPGEVARRRHQGLARGRELLHSEHGVLEARSHDQSDIEPAADNVDFSIDQMHAHRELWVTRQELRHQHGQQGGPERCGIAVRCHWLHTVSVQRLLQVRAALHIVRHCRGRSCRDA